VSEPKARVVLTGEAWDCYIGRGVPRCGWEPSRFGNPFIVGKDGTPDECVALFLEWFYAPEQAEFRELVRQELSGQRLRCHCKKPKQPNAPCHGDVYVEWVNADIKQLLKRIEEDRIPEARALVKVLLAEHGPTEQLEHLAEILAPPVEIPFSPEDAPWSNNPPDVEVDTSPLPCLTCGEMVSRHGRSRHSPLARNRALKVRVETLEEALRKIAGSEETCSADYAKECERIAREALEGGQEAFRAAAELEEQHGLGFSARRRG
jgi:hypothetical protein